MNQDPVSSPSNAHALALFPRISLKRACIIGAVLGVALLGYTQFGRFQDEKIWGQLKSIHAPVRQKQLRNSNEPWSQITPSKELEYHDCFDGFRCARLDVPMDWNQSNLDAGPRVQLAVARLPAKVPITDPRYGGLLWLQSGGPGESGIGFILTYGKSIQAIVDSPLDATAVISTEDDIASDAQRQVFYDILAIDSRGLNNSTPCFSCFPSASSKQRWDVRASAEGVLGSSDVSFSNLWARMQALSQGCSATTNQLAKHVNTAPQIADMIAVIEKHGQWRQREAARVLSPDHQQQAVLSEEVTAITQRTKWRRNEEQLLFWGFSYGTVIGAHFAAMQPHRVQRMVLDGVVDTPDYMAGTRLQSLHDTDSIVDRQAKNCFLAGRSRCPLYDVGGAEKIAESFRNIIVSLKRHPLSVPGDSDGGAGTLAPDIITYSDVIGATFNALYAPIQSFPPLMSDLAGIARGNGTAFAARNQKTSRQSFPSAEETTSDHQPPSKFKNDNSACLTQRLSPGDTRTAIMCTDVNGTSGMSQVDFKNYIAQLETQSAFFSGPFAQVRMKCIDWQLRPTWRFNGPFAAPGGTNFPLLFVGATRDPVTPIANAHTLATRFPNSAVLAVDTDGHSSLSGPSLCMARHIRAYFQKGELPTPGTVCEVNEKSFLGVLKEAEGTEERKLLDVLRWTSWHWND
ncbi:MAG: hypothetical protein LQ339_005118 [Xanthoria mediterranea]|nr:MAG: hypothetical protein LQ339_005118 [Xanthoria mediterranea]